MKNEEAVKHRWKFIRIGGVEQVTFRDGRDIVNLDQLDQKLWAALACPASRLEFDGRTMELLDTDKDGRLRAPEIIEISRWARAAYSDPDELLKGGDRVSISAISDSNELGKSLRAATQRVHSLVGATNRETVSLQEVAKANQLFAMSPFNGDGVVPADSAEKEEVRRAIQEILSVQAPATDLSGEPGVNLAVLDNFVAEATAFLDWQEQSRTKPEILPLGEKTESAARPFSALRSKIDDYFARARLAGFDPRATTALNRSEADYLTLANKDLTVEAQEIAHLPLARVEGDRPLPLKNGVNPAWSATVAQFSDETVRPVLSAREMLSQEDWRALQEKFAAFEKWVAAKPKAAVEKLGVDRLRELVQSGVIEEIKRLIEMDLAQKRAGEEIAAVEKLVRVQRDLLNLLNNFVSFSDFYGRRGAIFQAGTLYLDGRSCDLCLRVADASKHAALAGLAKAYLAYCDCTRSGGEKMSIVAAFTAGSSDYLMAGRNGVFYDRQGLDWDATITKIVENPISIGQAFWSPYKKFVRMIEEQVAKRAAAAEAASEAKLTTAATQVSQADASKPAAPPAPKRIDVGTVAALGVALGSLATFLGLIFTKFIDLGWWIPLALVGLILAISGPSVLVAWLKLRQRNLGPILDANGWAVNGRMKINVPFGGALSKTAKLPPGAQVVIGDPFRESHAKRNVAIALVLAFAILAYCWRLGILNPYLPAVLQRRVPAAQVVVPTNAAPAVVTTNSP